ALLTLSSSVRIWAPRSCRRWLAEATSAISLAIVFGSAPGSAFARAGMHSAIATLSATGATRRVSLAASRKDEPRQLRLIRLGSPMAQRGRTALVAHAPVIN